MLALAAVPESYRRRLDRAAGQRFTFLGVPTWAAAIEAIRREPLELAAVDPALEGIPRAHEIERIRVLFPSLPLVLYTSLSADVVPVLLELGRIGIRDVVLAGHDDHPDRLRELVVREAAASVSRQLLDELADLLASCPGELRWAIETAVREPTSLHTVADLARRARMDRRTCNRWFAKAGLPPPRVMLTVFRVIYAHRLLQDPGYTVEDVATKLGYARTRSFAQNVKEVFGVTPGELRVSLAPEEALRMVRKRYFGRRTASLASAS